MVCIGNSHLACVLIAARDQGTPLDAVILKDSPHFNGVRAGAVVSDKRYRGSIPRDAVQRLAQGPVFSFIGGTKHSALGMAKTRWPFDFVLPEDPELALADTAEVVPVNAVRTFLKREIRRSLNQLEELRGVVTGLVYQFDAPPPPSTDWFSPADDPRLSAKRGKGNLVPLLRYKLWRLHSEIVREHAEQIGVTFVPCPDEALGEHGLREEFVRNQTHANEAYGTLVLAQMKALP